MADWTAINDSQVDPDAPITSELGYAFRDNPIAIAEGAAGAPRIMDAALDLSSPTAAGANWIGQRYHLKSFDGLSMILEAVYTGGAARVDAGDIVAGTNLNYNGGAAGGQPPGTWRCQGLWVDTAPDNPTIWIRVS